MSDGPFDSENCSSWDAEFMDKAKSALEIMERRGWVAIKKTDGYQAYELSFSDAEIQDDHIELEPVWAHLAFGIGRHKEVYQDPFTALIATDNWLKKLEQASKDASK